MDNQEKTATPANDSLLDYQITDSDIASKGVVSAPDRLVGTAAENKQVFDALIREAVKDKFNGLIEALMDTGAAAQIGAQWNYLMYGSTVQELLEDIATTTNNYKILLRGTDGAENIGVHPPSGFSDTILQDLLDSIAAAIRDIDGLPEGGSVGQALRMTSGGAAWGDVNEVPTAGLAGQVLRRNNSGAGVWGDVNEVPAGGETGQVLRMLETGMSGWDAAVAAGLPFGVCATTRNVAAKTVTVKDVITDPATALPLTGAQVLVRFFTSNIMDNPTLNVNGTGAYPITWLGDPIQSGWLLGGRDYIFVFDGTNWELTGASGPYVTAGRAVSSTIGSLATAEGRDNIASGSCAHAEGIGNTVSGYTSHAEGTQNTASSAWTHAEGSNNTAGGLCAHAEGSENTASGTASHAEGANSVASGSYSHARGRGAVANHLGQSASGTYNTPDASTAAASARGNYIEIVGNGTDEDNRGNARTLDWDGNEVLAGKLTLGAAGTASLDAASYGQLQSHTGDSVVHITAAERQAWNEKQAQYTFDNLPTAGSTNPVYSGGVYTALSAKADNSSLAAHVGDSTAHVTAADKAEWDAKADGAALNAHVNDSAVHASAAEKAAWNAKQDALTIDAKPTLDSANPVASGGVYNALDAKAAAADLSSHAGDSAIHVTAAEKAAWNDKQDAMIVDPTPIRESGNLVSSGGVYAALAAKSSGAKKGAIALSATWNGSGPYTQTVTVSGASVDSASQVDLQPDAAQLAQLIFDGVQAMVVENSGGTLTVYAVGGKTSVAMTVQCTVAEVGSR